MAPLWPPQEEGVGELCALTKRPFSLYLGRVFAEGSCKHILLTSIRSFHLPVAKCPGCECDGVRLQYAAEVLGVSCHNPLQAV